MPISSLLRGFMAALTCVALSAHAQVDTIKIMAPANPGGGFDTVARVLADALRASGQAKSVSVENKAGAGGAIGLAQFINTEKGNPTSLIVAGAVTAASIEANKSPVNLSMVTPIARLMGEYNVIVVPPASPIKNMKDLAAALKANPGAVAIGGGSAGSVDHVMVALIGETVGVHSEKINYVAFAGGGEGKAAILGGQLAAYVSGYGELVDLIKAGKLRAIGLSADTRQKDIDVPTMKEQGVDVVMYNWRGVFAPAGITEPQKRQLVGMVEAAMKDASWKSKAEKLEWLELYQPADTFKAFVDSESRRLKDVIGKLKLN
ncbi:MAG TPA: tripartite tricarboxylate transporter substrate binding protein [Rhodocyclaceae bacterium]|nr:tripartite tricarboxylate transporter substrate binding protein [Rhodocyclaceae bacterium]